MFWRGTTALAFYWASSFWLGQHSTGFPVGYREGPVFQSQVSYFVWATLAFWGFEVIDLNSKFLTIKFKFLKITLKFDLKNRIWKLLPKNSHLLKNVNPLNFKTTEQRHICKHTTKIAFPYLSHEFRYFLKYPYNPMFGEGMILRLFETSKRYF